MGFYGCPSCKYLGVPPETCNAGRVSIRACFCFIEVSMAKGRMLNRTISMSLQFHALPDDTCRLVATWIIPYLDTRGVFYADPLIVKGMVVPMRTDITPDDIKCVIDAMADVGLIKLFSSGGHVWQYWPGFKKNQHGMRPAREGECIYPEYIQPDETAMSEQVQLDSVPTPELLRTCSGVTPPEVKLREVKLIGASAPSEIPETEEPMNLHDLDTIVLTHTSKDHTLKTIAKQRCGDNAKALMIAFYEASGIPFTKTWLAAANEMEGIGVQPSVITAAHKKLIAGRMSVVDLYSVKKTAISLSAMRNHKQPLVNAANFVEMKDSLGNVTYKQVGE